MAPEQLKKKVILVKYLFPDNLPERGYKRMQYYTSFADDPEKFYLGLSTRTPYSREKLKAQVKLGQLLELIEPVTLPYENDLYLNEEGKIIMMSGFNSKDERKQVVASPKELSKAKMLLKKLDDTRLKVAKRTKIPAY